jgi:hypothetical protein
MVFFLIHNLFLSLSQSKMTFLYVYVCPWVPHAFQAPTIEGILDNFLFVYREQWI